MSKLSKDYYDVVFPGLISSIIVILIFFITLFVFHMRGSLLISLGTLLVLYSINSLRIGKIAIENPISAWFFYINSSNFIGKLFLTFLILIGILLIYTGLFS